MAGLESGMDKAAGNRHGCVMSISFTSRQDKIVSSAVTALALLTLTALGFFVFTGLIRFLSAFSSVFLPLAAAGILSLLLRPLYQWIRRKWKLPPPAAVSLILLLFLLPLLILFGVFGGLLLRQLTNLVSSLPALVDSLRAWIQENAPAVNAAIEEYGGMDQVRQWAKNQLGPLLNMAAGGAQGLLAMAGAVIGVFSWAVLPVYLIFLLMAPPFPFDKLEEFMPYVKEKHRADAVFLVRQFVDIVVSFFRGQLVIAFAQGVMMAVGFSAAGLSYGFILGLLMGMLNLVPYLGNLIGLMVTLPLAYFQSDGGLALVAGVIVVLAITQTVESYVLTPRIMGKSTGLHPMAVIFAMFFWGKALGGVFGLILAIPLTAFLVVLWRLAREKYLQYDQYEPGDSGESGLDMPGASAENRL